jgi:hypothetical protein
VHSRFRVIALGLPVRCFPTFFNHKLSSPVSFVSVASGSVVRRPAARSTTPLAISVPRYTDNPGALAFPTQGSLSLAERYSHAACLEYVILLTLEQSIAPSADSNLLRKLVTLAHSLQALHSSGRAVRAL